MLLWLPGDYAGRGELLELFRRFAQGILHCQDDSGLWHQVLDRPDSYLETSCTAMFLLGMARGVRLGWLGQDYQTPIRKAWQGLMRRAIYREGNIRGVCKGSGCSYDPAYYAQLETVDNDDHGTGIVLAAICELLRLEGKPPASDRQ